MGSKKISTHSYEKFIEGINYTPIIPQKSYNISKLIDSKIDGVSADELVNFIATLFPEIQSNLVLLRYKKIATTMSSRPIISSLISNKRQYEIIINSTKEFHGINFKDIPINAKIGLIAHEFSHILDYQRKSTIEIFKTAFLYLLNKQNYYEKSIDYLTIQKGFGWQLWSWSDYVFNHSKASTDYLNFKRKNYFSPDDIKAIIDNNKNYEN